jgi:hypothetical protein
MNRFLRRLAYRLATLAVAAGFGAPAWATVSSADYTDIWYIPAESGWGFNVIQQGDTLFGTLFVYGTDQSPRWFVADAMVLNAASSASAVAFQSNFYQVAGPYFGAGTFNSAGVTATLVGTASVTFDSVATGTLTYSVNGVSVAKRIQRQTFRNNVPLGQYFGGMSSVLSACTDATLNRNFADFNGQVTVASNGSNIMFQVDYALGGALASCVFNGTYAQQGRLGSVTNGSWSCVQGTSVKNTGTFSLSRVDAQIGGMSASIVATDQFCTYTGFLGGVTLAN